MVGKPEVEAPPRRHADELGQNLIFRMDPSRRHAILSRSAERVCFRCFFLRSLLYLTGRMPSPIPTEPERGNILIRAVLGLGVRHTLESHADRIALHPESADAERLAALRFVRRLAALGTVMSRDAYRFSPQLWRWVVRSDGRH
jgi:hypothetical protein